MKLMMGEISISLKAKNQLIMRITILQLSIRANLPTSKSWLQKKLKWKSILNVLKAILTWQKRGTRYCRVIRMRQGCMRMMKKWSSVESIGPQNTWAKTVWRRRTKQRITTTLGLKTKLNIVTLRKYLNSSFIFFRRETKLSFLCWISLAKTQGLWSSMRRNTLRRRSKLVLIQGI